MKKSFRTKKASPSTLRRNARRRQEYLIKKQNPPAVNHTAEVAAVPVALPCDQCDYKATSERGLKTHRRMKHGPPRLTPPAPAATPTSPEKLRGPGQMRSALNTSPLSLSNREENCHSCGGPFSPLHQCGEVETGGGGGALDGDQAGKGTCTCDCELPICCNCLHEPECSCCDENPDSGVCNCEGFVFHH